MALSLLFAGACSRALVGGEPSIFRDETRACAKPRSLGGLRQHPPARQPAMNEMIEPGTLCHVIDGAVREVMMPLPGAGRAEAVIAARGPAMHHRVGHVGMKLDAKGIAGPKRLHRKIVAF